MVTYTVFYLCENFRSQKLKVVITCPVFNLCENFKIFVYCKCFQMYIYLKVVAKCIVFNLCENFRSKNSLLKF